MKGTVIMLFSFSFVICLLQFITVSEGGYIITTPKKWITDEEAQVCLTLDQLSSPDDVINIRLTSINDKILLNTTKLPIVPGERSQCMRLKTTGIRDTNVNLHVTGKLTGSSLNYTEKMGMEAKVHETYVQTDKYLYKPGQIVKFRLLSVSGPKLRLETGQYDEIWVENPSGSRIAQWLNVTNEKSLIHKELQLTEEPEEGTYKIKVNPPFFDPLNKLVTAEFKVEDYVLPRFEVTITPPNYVLGSTKAIPFTVCAKYTFGQPVKGLLTFKVHNNGWGSYKVETEAKRNISGCETIIITDAEIDINSKEYYSYSLKANAILNEAGTDVLIRADEVSVDVTRTAISFEDVSVQEFLKPELPFLVEVKATFPDKSPAKNEPMKVCSGETCKTFTTDASGLLKYFVPPHLSGGTQTTAVNYPRIKDENSWRSIMYESNYWKNFKKYHSPSNSSLILFLTEKTVTCTPGETMQLSLPIKFSAVNQTEAYVTVQVVSRGIIQFSRTSNVEFTADTTTTTTVNEDLYLAPVRDPVTVNAIRGMFTLQVDLAESVSPKAKVVVWYTRTDGEVVSDYREIDITNCLPHTASLAWSVSRAKPGTMANLKLEALPNSLCSVGVVDKSVELLSAVTNKLTVQNLLDVAQRGSSSEYEFSQVNDFEYCKKKEEESTPLPPGGGIPPIEPPVAIPESPPIPPPVALPFIPDIVPGMGGSRKKRSSVPWGGRPYQHYFSDDVDAINGFDKAGLLVLSDLTLETRPCSSGHGYNFLSTKRGGAAGNRRRNRPANVNRFATVAHARPPVVPDVPDANTTSTQSETSTNTLRSYFPETWLWELVNLPSTGVNEEALKLPDTVTEWIGRAVCVHPSGGVGLTDSSSITTYRDFFADLTLPASVKRGEVFPVKISVFNYLKDALPIKVELYQSPEFEIIRDLDFEGNAGERSSCLQAEDKDVHEIKIRPTVFGDVNITVKAYVDTNTVKECGTKTGDDRFRSDILVKPVNVEIEGFEKEDVHSKYICSQDIQEGNDLLESWDLTPPAGIIENSARGWVSVVGDLMGPTIENLGKLVKMPYGCGEQNMLNFAPNIFVMQYLDASNQNTEAISTNAIKYMEKGYQRELNYRHDVGSFSAFGKSDESGSTWLTAFVLKSFAQARPYISVDAKDLTLSSEWLKSLQQENGCFESVGKVLHKGMKGGVDKSKSLSLLTAFVLISLMESGESATSRSVKEAQNCLVAEPLGAEDPYALAVRTYALALSGHEKALEGANNLLVSATTKGATLFWELPESLETGKGVGVETAAYAVLALLTLDSKRYSVDARRIIKWMNNQRNGQGGFVSTQDTIVALQAMAAYEKELPQGNVELTVMVETGVDKVEFFTVNENNKLLLQQRDIPSFPTTISSSLEGVGCALIQATLRYNVPDPVPSSGFDVSVTTSTYSDPSCKTKNIAACATYTLADKTSNMAILEVNLVSGYIPEKKDLKRIVADTMIIKRYEVDGSKVTFYFDELSENETCVSFRVIRTVLVDNPKPGSVVVYDYYKPELSTEKSYVLPAPTECLLRPPPPDGVFLEEARPLRARLGGEDLPVIAPMFEEERPVVPAILEDFASIDGIP